MSIGCRRGSRRSAVKRLHVNQHVLRANKATGRRDQPLTVKYRGQNLRASSVRIQGPSTLVYRPDDPLDCGATVWIETESTLRIDDPENAVRYGPQVNLSVTLVEHGLQADFSDDMDGSSFICRDFSGNHKIDVLRLRLLEHLQKAIHEFVKNPDGKSSSGDESPVRGGRRQRARTGRAARRT